MLIVEVIWSICSRVGHGLGPSMGRVGSGRAGSQNSPSWVGQVGSSPVSKISTKCIIYTQKTDYSATIIHSDKKL